LPGPSSLAPTPKYIEFYEKPSPIPWIPAELLTRTARAKQSLKKCTTPQEQPQVLERCERSMPREWAELPRTSQSPVVQSCSPPPLLTADTVVAQAETLLQELNNCPFPDVEQHASMLERCHNSLRDARDLQQQNEPRRRIPADVLMRTARAKQSPIKRTTPQDQPQVLERCERSMPREWAELPRTSQSPGVQSCSPSPLLTVDTAVEQAEKLLQDLLNCPFPDVEQHAAMLERCRNSLRTARALQQQNEPRPQPCPHVARPPCRVHGAQSPGHSNVLQTPLWPATPPATMVCDWPELLRNSTATQSPVQHEGSVQSRERREKTASIHQSCAELQRQTVQLKRDYEELGQRASAMQEVWRLRDSQRGKDKSSEGQGHSLMSWLVAAVKGELSRKW
jgi:hypothetical protein